MRGVTWAWAVFCLSFIGVGACAKSFPVPDPPALTSAAPKPPARDIPALPYNIAVIHVDEAFSEDERAHIRNAATAWNLFTQGQAQLVPVEGGVWAENVHRILRVNASPKNALVDMVDAQHPGYQVLGFMVPPKHPWGPREIFVIMDRVNSDQFHWIVTHEMGHFLGLDDLQEPGHVMSGVGRFQLDWFTPSDLRECQAAQVCK